MKTECPGDNVDPLCETIDSSDLLTGLPVVDEHEGVVYRNVFCARCNSVASTSYWQLFADCGRIPSSALPKDNAKLTAFIMEYCSINYSPTVQQQPHIKKCLAARSNCSSKERVSAQPILKELCSFYSLPVCGNSYKNPHCALCSGDDITRYNCGCKPLTGPSTNPSTTPSPTPSHEKSTGTTWTSRGSNSPETTAPRKPTKPGVTTPTARTTNSETQIPGHSSPHGSTIPGVTTQGNRMTTPWNLATLGTKTPGHSTITWTTSTGHLTRPKTTRPGNPATPEKKPPGQTSSQPFTSPYIPTTLPHWPSTGLLPPTEHLTVGPVTHPRPRPRPPPPPPPPPTLPDPPPPPPEPPKPPKPPHPPPPPPLSILFNFGSNQISIQGKTTEVNHKTCKEGFVYDPFTYRCRETLRKVSFPNTNSSVNSTNSTIDVNRLNCSFFIRLNASITVLYPNGTLWVPLYDTLYNQTNFFVNGSYVFLCTNFSSNYSTRETLWSYLMSPVHILTYAGCSVSFLSLLILVVIYGVFKELRTLPGKNLINLSLAMIFYHIFLFVAGSRNIHRLCIMIAVLLHYFLLSSFAWMSVMAFDVAKTFAFRGKKLQLTASL